MLAWATSIGRILAAQARCERARHEKVMLERLYLTRFCSTVVLPALHDLAREFECHGRTVDVRGQGNLVSITVCHGERVEFRYAILASRRQRSKPGGRYRDETGYGRTVDKVYSLRDARRLRPNAVARQVVAEYRRRLVATGLL
jgi:hypothetical protein